MARAGVLLLLVCLIARTAEAAAPQIVGLSCTNGETILGRSDRGEAFRWENGAWKRHRLQNLEPIDRLWVSPGGGAYISDFAGHVAELSNRLEVDTLWTLPGWSGSLALGFLETPVAVTPDQTFPLLPGGTLGDAIPTPQPMANGRSLAAPALMIAAGRTVACYRGSVRVLDAMKGHCIGQPPGSYDYPIDFGEKLESGDPGPTPFACGDFVISVHDGFTAARRGSDGSVAGQRRGRMQPGSRCLNGGRMLWVDQRQVAVFTLPEFRETWSHRVPGPAIADAAVCNGKVVLLQRGQRKPVTLALP